MTNSLGNLRGDIQNLINRKQENEKLYNESKSVLGDKEDELSTIKANIESLASKNYIAERRLKELILKRQTLIRKLRCLKIERNF